MKLKLKTDITIYAALCCIFFTASINAEVEHAPFIWNQDALWKSLEDNFVAMKLSSSEKRLSQYKSISANLLNASLKLGKKQYPATDPIFQQIQNDAFTLSSIAAADQSLLDGYISQISALRFALKLQINEWNLDKRENRNTAYKLLYGIRTAVDEVLLQSSRSEMPSIIYNNDIPSETPSIERYGITLHSGDILISRGGAPASSLISRGNDYPGNFSHAALLYIDEQTHKAYVIESLIESGVVVNDADSYIKDLKYRIMVLRIRPDILSKLNDPLIPHKAALTALQSARKQHIPYDFSMNYIDHSKMFCSEVVSSAYSPFKITLWKSLSSISGSGIRNWLSDFGVTNFITQKPTDLEYDSNVLPVVEWLSPRTLLDDHLDNASTDALITAADNGEKLSYNPLLLAPAALVKGYSSIKNKIGSTGPIPEGMKATSALKTKRFNAIHTAVKKDLKKKVKEFAKKHGYNPPYWEMVEMANDVVKNYLK